MCAEAVEDARHNAKLNHVDNIEFHVGKAEDVLQPAIAKLTDKDVVVGIVDPPRAGLREWHYSPLTLT
jgi:tRNA/tmRNA/rRNA uracil-C5-methylase (TrmA/RlmC/RlmD family)